jgi:hypothetical protein
VIGGLITSTLLTLFVLPTLYGWLEEWRKRARPDDWEDDLEQLATTNEKITDEQTLALK